MADAQWANIDRKSVLSHQHGVLSHQHGHFDSKFQVDGVAPHQSFLHG